MLNIVENTNNLTRQEWLEWRKNGIGGSDASIVCGMNKYKSAFQLWMEKTNRVESKEAGEAAYWGNVLEPIIREEFCKRTGFKIQIEKSIIQHPIYPFMFANIDGIVIDDQGNKSIFEAKTANAFLQDDWEDGIPDAYLLQVQHYMAVTGFDKAYVAVLIGGNQFKWTIIERDDELILMMVMLEKQFWQYVETDTPPPLDGSDSASEFLSNLYPLGKKDNRIELSLDALELIKVYEDSQEQEKFFSNKKTEASNKLKSMLGLNDIGIVDDRIVCWSNVNSERFDSTLFKSENQEIYKSYIKNSTYRRFSIKKPCKNGV